MRSTKIVLSTLAVAAMSWLSACMNPADSGLTSSQSGSAVSEHRVGDSLVLPDSLRPPKPVLPDSLRPAKPVKPVLPDSLRPVKPVKPVLPDSLRPVKPVKPILPDSLRPPRPPAPPRK